MLMFKTRRYPNVTINKRWLFFVKFFINIWKCIVSFTEKTYKPESPDERENVSLANSSRAEIPSSNGRLSSGRGGSSLANSKSAAGDKISILTNDRPTATDGTEVSSTNGRSGIGGGAVSSTNSRPSTGGGGGASMAPPPVQNLPPRLQRKLAQSDRERQKNSQSRLFFSLKIDLLVINLLKNWIFLRCCLCNTLKKMFCA